MPSAPHSPMVRRRRLGAELRRLREAAGMTGDQVIQRTGWASASKLSRLENGRSRPNLGDVLDLLDLYGVSRGVREDLVEITRDAGDTREWRRSYPVMTQRQRGYAELEAGSVEIREYSPMVVPGLLQTAEYARFRIVSSRPLLTVPRHRDRRPAGDPETEVAARLARQSLLTRDTAPPAYAAILEEVALRGRAGPPEVVRDQLAHLRALAVLPNVTLQVLPLEATIADWYLPHIAFSIYRFGHPEDPETLAIEGLTTDLVLTDRTELERYGMVFDWLRAAARTPEDTVAWLAEEAARVARGRVAPARSGPDGRAHPPAQRNRRIGDLRD